MKVLLVIDSFGSGGAQRQIINLAKGLTYEKYEVDFFSYHGSNFYRKLENVNYYTFKNNSTSKILKTFKLISHLRKIIIKNKYNAIICFLHSPSILTSIAKLGISRGKLILCERNSSFAEVSFIKRNLFRLALLISDYVVTNSYSESKILKKNLFLKSKTSTIWNGYELNYNKQKVQEQIYFTKNILIVGRVTNAKNGLNILKALNVFYNNHGWSPNIYWVGRIDKFDKNSNDYVLKMIDYLGNNKHLNFNFVGEVKDIYELFSNYDLLLHVTKYEGLPNVICEAMILGCPVIASNICDHPKILDNNRGILCDPNSPQSISTALHHFYSLEKNEIKKIKINASEFANKEFSLQKMLNSYIELINK